LNGSIKPPGGENGRDGEASTFLAEGDPENHLECQLPGFQYTESNVKKYTKPNVKKLALSIPGWLITAFAIYMGAPFWFEILGKLVQVRSIGKTSKSP
jgi:hypothetical protein